MFLVYPQHPVYPKNFISLFSNFKGRIISLSISRFWDGESCVKLQDKRLINEDIVLLYAASASSSNDDLIRILLLVDALKRYGVGRISAILPYIPYMRQDSINETSCSLGAEVVASLLSRSGVAKIYTFEMHSKQSLSFFNTSICDISMLDVFLTQIQNEAFDIVVSPDIGMLETANKFGIALNKESVAMHKVRSQEGIQIAMNFNVSNKRCLLVDDIVASGTTLVEAGKVMRNCGAQSITVCIMHVTSFAGLKRVCDSGIFNRVIISNSILHAEFMSSNNLPNLGNLDIIPICSALSEVLS